MSNVTAATLQESRQIAENYLRSFIGQSNFEDDFSIAFSENFDREEGLAVINSLIGNDLSNLNIEIIPSQEINNGQGAYVAGTNTIYLAQQYVTENSDNPNAIASIILEEVGHYVDWRVNIEDAPGDEGAIFASLVLEDELSAEDLAVLRTEDDSSEVVIDGETVTIEQAQTIFVNQSATGENDGTSWANAYTDLQDVIANAEPNDEVWVAAGTYLPTIDDDRNISFSITEFVQFYGGFAGTETERDERDIAANETILSGNIGVADDETDNSYHVVNITGTAATTVLDGFTISDGYAEGIGLQGFGGGVFSSESGNAALSNLIIKNNFAEDNGGGMYIASSSNPILTDVLFDNNEAGVDGGGTQFDNSSPTFDTVTFINNLAGDDGGGIVNVQSNPILNGVFVRDNVANDLGGGLYNFQSGNTQVINSVFAQNQSQTGGAIYSFGSDYNIVNSTFYGNISDFAGAIYTDRDANSVEGVPIIANSIITNNFGTLDELQIVDETSVITTNNSIIEGGYEEGANILDVDPRFVDPEEGNFRIRSNSPAIDRGDGSVIDAEFDLAGQERVVNESVDLGAFEFQDNLPAGAVYRLFNPEVGVHFYTSNREERNSVIETLPNYEYEGAAFQTLTEAEADPVTGAKPVYRFFNVDTGVHLYTIEEVERDVIQETLPNFVFEGISYYAFETEQEGTIPLYRFFNPEVGAHFYTPFAAERDNVIETLPQYQLEGDSGVAFHVLPLTE